MRRRVAKRWRGVPGLAPIARVKARPKKKVDYPGTLIFQMKALGITTLISREYEFHPVRQWRLDIYLPAMRLGIECHGGIFSGGRHVQAEGYTRDREKMNAAIECGIKVLEYTAAQIKSGQAVQQILRIYQAWVQSSVLPLSAP